MEAARPEPEHQDENGGNGGYDRADIYVDDTGVVLVRQHICYLLFRQRSHGRPREWSIRLLTIRGSYETVGILVILFFFFFFYVGWFAGSADTEMEGRGEGSITRQQKQQQQQRQYQQQQNEAMGSR